MARGVKRFNEIAYLQIMSMFLFQAAGGLIKMIYGVRVAENNKGQNSYSIPTFALRPKSVRRSSESRRRLLGHAQTIAELSAGQGRSTAGGHTGFICFTVGKEYLLLASRQLPRFTRKNGMLFSQGMRRKVERSIVALMSVYPIGQRTWTIGADHFESSRSVVLQYRAIAQ